MSICFETLKSSEIQLQQSNASLQDQLLEKEQKISQLEGQLQQDHEALPPLQQDVHSKHMEQVRSTLFKDNNIIFTCFNLNVLIQIIV